MVKKFIEQQLKDANTPIKIGFFSKLNKKNKLKVIIFNEDNSYNEYFIKYPDSYVIEIKKRSYFVIPKCISRSNFSTIFYYYNNPLPIFFEYEKSKLTAYDLRDDEQIKKLTETEKLWLAKSYMDAETINLAFNTRVIRGIYGVSGVTAKTIIIILVVVTIVVLVFLQVFGVVDVVGMVSGVAK